MMLQTQTPFLNLQPTPDLGCAVSEFRSSSQRVEDALTRLTWPISAAFKPLA